MTCGHIGGSLWGENIQAPFPRGKVIEFMHMQKARLASPKCLQAFVHEKQHEQLPKGRQDPLASNSEDTPSWRGDGRLSGGGGGKISSRMIFQSSMVGRGLWSTRQGLETWALFSWLGDLG